MNRQISIGIVGATGAVGIEILNLLDSRSFPIEEIRLFASPASLGKTIDFKGQVLEAQIINDNSFENLDIVFFCAGNRISKQYAKKASAAGALVIDNSSAFRMSEEVPLIIPEINPQAIDLHQGIIANPNCSTIIMLMVLAPLHKVCPIKRIVACTYQAASGAGGKGMEDLIGETGSYFSKEAHERSVIPFPYAFNLFLHNSPLLESDYCEEEMKMVYETRKILNEPQLKINATCVRVPVLRAHSEALNVEFYHPLSATEAYRLLEQAPGLCRLEDREQNRFPMPIDAVGKTDVFYGRIRQDISQSNTLDLWVVADQLLKGAALNAVQIAELAFGIYTKSDRSQTGSMENIISS
ncbi:MAG: aspartate-semialdehyde dehydrogenase [Chlamydiae bacterium]|nr:aspartate-semialdehyde dehydrogenase [Chlamydiota bacterium]